MAIEYSAEEIENMRLGCIAEHDDSDEPVPAGQEKVDWLAALEEAAVPGTFSYHEALHATSMMAESLGIHVLEHPAVLMDREAFLLAHRAHTALANLYGYLGDRHLTAVANNEN